MRVLNIGSINIDHVYEVDHFVRPGETLGGLSYHTFAGGKGFNQSITLARAGATTFHAGRVGKNAAWLLQRLEQEGVDTTHVTVGEDTTGHAIIQVVPDGENAIVLYGGANQRLTEADVASALASFSAGDILLLQNETSSVAWAMQNAHERGMRIVFNPAPMTADVHHYPLGCVDVFVLNETEAEELTGATDPAEVRARMRERFPRAATVLTLGNQGATYFDADSTHHEPALLVDAVDTTAAGDTFIGYFLAELMQTGDPVNALAKGCRAAAICVTRAGASDSIPSRNELETVQVNTSG
ncbi:MAG: ribokinase [Pseudomonadota bacterium]|nr:ribokinase [Pseudomonadota bacterium]MDP1903198.1 ribokinase [Pseudomonadota bacterium]MDP2354427.1 ribokinase [Pseudomonadota bacterium]